MDGLGLGQRRGQSDTAWGIAHLAVRRGGGACSRPQLERHCLGQEWVGAAFSDEVLLLYVDCLQKLGSKWGGAVHGVRGSWHGPQGRTEMLLDYA